MNTQPRPAPCRSDRIDRIALVMLAACVSPPAWAGMELVYPLLGTGGITAAMVAAGLYLRNRRSARAREESDLTILVAPAPRRHGRSRRIAPPARVTRSVQEFRIPEPIAEAPQEAVSEWSLELIEALEWKRFEDTCAAYFRLKGMRNHATPLGLEGGVDLRLLEDDGFTPEAIVQCRSMSAGVIDDREIEHTIGLLREEGLERGFFVAVGGFTEAARSLAMANRITPIDSRLLLAMIQRLPEPSRQRLLSFATAGDYRTPTCPHCGLRRREGALGGCACKGRPHPAA